MKKRAVVLGCGLVGATMARDMASDPAYAVRAMDVSDANLNRLRGVDNIETRQADLGNPTAIKAAVADADVVLGAMPSALGLMVLRSVIESRKPFADISFMAEDARQLDVLAREREVTAVVDCGVAPGLANMIVGHGHAALERTTRVAYYVGGLPKNPTWPYGYKAPFAPGDVIEEYTRPARLKVNGAVVTRPALSDREMFEFDRVGPLEAFNTDGLRSLLDTIDCPNMVEKTLRYPGHAELMAVLRETGYFNKDELDVRGVKVRPIDVTARLLFPLWKHAENEAEFTLLRVIVEGQQDGRDVRIIHELYDEFEPATKQSSMARTTGFPCAIVARMLAEGRIARHGVLPPEALGMMPGVMEHVTAELARRGVRLQRSET